MAVIVLKNKQVAELCNDALKTTLGENATILSEDLTEVVDVGVSLANANAYKNFIENLMVATSKYIFRYRAYESKAPNVLPNTGSAMAFIPIVIVILVIVGAILYKIK